MRKYYYCCLILLLISCSKENPEPVKSSAKSIITYVFNTLNPPVIASIDSTQGVIKATLPVATDIINLVPTITISGRATITPATGVAQDFRKPVQYKVTAEDGSSRTYTVNISVLKSAAKSINSFTFNSVSPAVTASIDTSKQVITAILPLGTDLSKLAPSVVTSDRASLSPASGVPKNFNEFVIYTVTAENGSSQNYRVNVATISEQPIQVKMSATKLFSPKTILCKRETRFGEVGYSFEFYDTDMSCSANRTPPASFFMTKLELGAFTGDGPFFYESDIKGSTSFFGSSILITKITATTVEGKVKGGDISNGKYGDMYMEGKFMATLCK
ncbi:DUF5018 domain-containing protein [Spirosoma sp. BT702]|uniref:DUF5018 domain-containing protein n=1 Tax=Spirosoma profusum TaxID=2771354 RepID=A0A926Y1U3_9BACT|nr:DUF5018 domain-containing protein [Spirosoma profusum]MBD2700326.1 DUF5018 domain-containing protein [Spirosoma profusum]